MGLLQIIPWKHAYADSWGKSSVREQFVRLYLEDAVPCEIEEGPGIGAGSSDFISGTAEENKKERSGPDWRVKGTRVYLEVTGPMKPISTKRPLWIRPDKVNAARFHKDRLTWVVHCIHDNSLMRAIFLDPRFFQEMRQGAFTLIERRIRGNNERYYEIPAGSRVVRPIETLVTFIRTELRKGEQALYF